MSASGAPELSSSTESGKLQYDKSFAEFAEREEENEFPFTRLEKEILSLYNRLGELHLEHGLLNASDSISLGITDDFSSDDIDEQLRIAQHELSDARARFALKNQIAENVIITDPILKAVHSGVNGTPAERDLAPLIDRRDTLSIAHTNLASALFSTRSSLTRKEVEHMRLIKTNQELARSVLQLADETNTPDVKAHRPEVLAQIDDLERGCRMQKSRWRIMKNVVAAAIVGSGVDWARDETFQALVLENEDAF